MFCKCVANVLVLYLTRNHDSNVLQMFHAKTFAKMLQNICKTFLQMFQQFEHKLKIGCFYV